MLVNLLQLVFKEYGGLTSLADQLDIHWYLYIILVLGKCGGLTRILCIYKLEVHSGEFGFHTLRSGTH